MAGSAKTHTASSKTANIHVAHESNQRRNTLHEIDKIDEFHFRSRRS